MIARQEVSKKTEDRINNIEKGLSLAKDAVQLDPHDGLSWSVLGNAHLSSFFGISQNPKTLKQGLSAYAQAVSNKFCFPVKFYFKLNSIFFLGKRYCCQK